jgi:hypothetical protein
MSVPSAGMDAMVEAPWLPALPEGSMCPSVEVEYAKRVGRSRAYVIGVGRDEDCSRRGTGVGRFNDVMGLGRGGNRP